MNFPSEEEKRKNIKLEKELEESDDSEYLNFKV